MGKALATMQRASESIDTGRGGNWSLVAGALSFLGIGDAVRADSVILVSRNTVGGALGFLSVPAASRFPGASPAFTVQSSNAGDTSTFDLAILNPVGAARRRKVKQGHPRALGRSRDNSAGNGFATLVAGTVTVTLSAFGLSGLLRAGSMIFHDRLTAAGTTGHLSAPDASRNVGAQTFVIQSSDALDTSTVEWVIFNPVQ